MIALQPAEGNNPGGYGRHQIPHSPLPAADIAGKGSPR
jgi:hypothetical protein